MRMKRIMKAMTSLLLLTLIFSSVAHAQDEQTIYVVQPGDSLYAISVQYGVSVDDLEAWNEIPNGVIHPGDELFVSPPNGDAPTSEDEESESEDSEDPADEVEEEAEAEEADEEASENGEVGSDEADEEVTTDNYIPTIVPNTYPPEVHVHLQNILNQFSDFPTLIQVDMLDEDNQYARINKDLNFNNTPIGRVIVLAYTLNKVERGGISWDQEFEYTEEIETIRSNYPVNMSGVSDSAFTSGSFTLTELVEGTLENDLNAFYLLLHHVGFENSEDLNLFVSNITGGQFTLDISTDEVHEYLTYIHDHNDQTIRDIWASLESVDSMIGSGDDIFLQLSAENDNVQYLSGIIAGETSYVITIISEHLDTHGSDGIALRINDNHDVEVGPNSYAFEDSEDKKEYQTVVSMFERSPALSKLEDTARVEYNTGFSKNRDIFGPLLYTGMASFLQ